ncbi:hypothetical protein [Candidatus Ichthyocystis sparus]|uniref:hypothetical protein n=1 Tax=Candidatus Ichthyocystis sparus TaxID=1561004 RepID=UPI000B87FC8C|nr:hypothetical protein [Candidatus Ichthyocystis sparus]
MCPVSATGAAAFNASESGGDNKEGIGESGVVQAGVSGSDLRQIEAATAPLAATASNVDITVREGGGASGGASVRKRKSARKRKSVAASDFTAVSGVFESLGAELHPDSAEIVKGLLLRVYVLAGCICRSIIKKQFPSNLSDELMAVGRTIWCNTYRVLCEVNFVHMCLREYHYKHRPDFIRSLPSTKVLSNSGRDVETLSGDKLLSFLSKLDSAVLGMVGSVFNSHWDEANVKVFAVEEGSLVDVSCKDFIDVLEIAGVPLIASSSAKHLRKKRSSRIRTSSKDIDKCTTASGGGSSSSAILEEGHMSSSSGCVTVSTHAETGGICSVVGEDLPIKCVDLLGFKFHPGSAELVYKVFCCLRESVRMSLSGSTLNHLLATASGELSPVGRAIWCMTYRELYLSSLIFKCLCAYHYKYRPNLIRELPNIRIVSSSSDCKLVPLSGRSLLDFLSKLDSAIRVEVKSMFDPQWDEVAGKIFARLGDVSLSDTSCEDIIGVLDTAGIPAVAFSASQRDTLSKRKKLENSNKVTCESTALEDGTTDLVSSSSGSHLQSKLPCQPESESLSEGAGSLLPHAVDSVAALNVSSEYFLTASDDLVSNVGDIAPVLEVSVDELYAPSLLPLVVDSVAASNVSGECFLTASDVLLVSTAGDVSPDPEVLVDESSALSSPVLVPESSPSLELEQMPMFPDFLHHHWLDGSSDML